MTVTRKIGVPPAPLRKGAGFRPPAERGAAPAPELETGGLGPGFGELRVGQLGVRIAASKAELRAAQALRYKVFYEDMGAQPSGSMAAQHRDFDEFDEVADHLLVIDHERGSGPKGIVGTYRLLRKSAADQVGRFYTAGEYDIGQITEFSSQILELGRSCIDPTYRGRAAMQLMWRGVAAYVFRHRIDVMFGCASLPGTDPDALAVQLSYLYHAHLAPPGLRLRAVPGRFVEMNRLEFGTFDAQRAMQSLPPLIKGYLRLGGFVGDGAVVDPQFNTTDVAVVVKTDLITDKYYRHYERQLRDALG
ncbi:GNAT family N-acetyltransferase [Endobacter medicaginis]|uniref:L-ornithine N(alpha)-acyltransferase n=1 Tax=Endobacter medicaginis TaxID=1181271 RepID=A0A850NPH4_9PROT|nr:GNAT family N-acyltransferase [Endobacter medicaginis]NVN31453.1 GNAT family N-acetyltransferase [Endobacter medicaginis]